jgi:light-regulated signal transduction histidine kinase (bacteriophytochrome)
MFAKLIGQQIDRERALQAAHKSNEVIQQYSENLKRSNQDLERFAYVVAHDLQAPLRSMAGFSELLQEKYANKLDERANEYIGFIVQGASHMQALISGVLTLSRVGRGGENPEATDCEAVLEQVLTQLRSVIRERGAKVTHDPLPSVLAVPLQINLLLQNLIGNAIKFQQKDTPRVHVSAERVGDHWRFSVRDEGIGIKPEDRERIFQVFQRLNPADKFEGTGIGLSICQRIVEHHGGQIWVESEPGKGSTFYFTLK